MRSTLLFGAALLTACPGPPAGRTPGNANRSGPDAPADQMKVALNKNLGQYRKRLRRCHELAMAEDYRLGGQLALRLRVRPMGVVTHVEVLQNTSGNKLLAACVQHVVKSFVFPAGDTDHFLPLKLRFAQPKAKLTVRMDDVLAKAKLGKGFMAKVLLHPKSVSGKGLSLSVLRLAAGARVPALKHSSDLAIYVLKGALQVTGGTRPVVLPAGDSAAIAAQTVFGLAPVGTSMCAAVVFHTPAGAEQLYLTGKPAAGSAWQPAVRPTPRSPVTLRAVTTTSPGDITLRGAELPVPQVVTVPAGRSATLNPGKADVHHALLVTAGAFYITVEGVKLPAEAGMSVYVPAKQSATLTPAGGRAARLVVQPALSKGRWTKKTVHRLIRLN